MGESSALDFLAMSTKEVGTALRELFQGADANGDGFLDQNEFVLLLRSRAGCCTLPEHIRQVRAARVQQSHDYPDHRLHQFRV